MPQIFLDCDGVLADFDAGARALFNMHPGWAEAALGKEAFWGALRDADNFFANLPLIEDAHQLYVGAAVHSDRDPIILTAAKRPNRDWMEPQKLAWRNQHFPGVKLICCDARDKCLHGKPGDILIDDYLKHRQRWIDMGGIFIHHTSAANSLAALEALLATNSNSATSSSASTCHPTS
jgi:hypothetical protein